MIVVEGPVASGKTAFAKELAQQLDMCHMEDVNMDQVCEDLGIIKSIVGVALPVFSHVFLLSL